MKILVLGSVNIDYSLTVDHIAVPGETINCSAMKKSAGGKGANQAYALARAGAKVYFAGNVGYDGRFIIDKLKDAGIDVNLVTEASEGTGFAFIQVDKTGQNSIVINGGGNREITTVDISCALRNFDKGDVIVLNGEISNIEYALSITSKRGMRIFLNASPLNDQIKNLDIGKASVLFFNEIEGEYFAGGSMPLGEMLKTLMKKYPDSEIVLTAGPEGAYYGYKNEIIFTPAVNVNAVDTTGAGDTFMGFFIAENCAGKTARECMETASKAAAITVSRYGAMDSIPSLSELNEEGK